MKSGRAKIGSFQKMRIKNLREGSVRSDLKKLDSSALETSKKHLIRNFLRNGLVRVNKGGYILNNESRNFGVYEHKLNLFQGFSWLSGLSWFERYGLYGISYVEESLSTRPSSMVKFSSITWDRNKKSLRALQIYKRQKKR